MLSWILLQQCKNCTKFPVISTHIRDLKNYKTQKKTKAKKILEFVSLSSCNACKSEEELQCTFIVMEDHEFVKLMPATH